MAPVSPGDCPGVLVGGVGFGQEWGHPFSFGPANWYSPDMPTTFEHCAPVPVSLIVIVYLPVNSQFRGREGEISLVGARRMGKHNLDLPLMPEFGRGPADDKRTGAKQSHCLGLRARKRCRRQCWGEMAICASAVGGNRDVHGTDAKIDRAPGKLEAEVL